MTRTIDGTTYSLALTDTAGQEEYRGLWSSSNIRSDAFLLVYDITQQSSLQSLEYFNSLIEMERENRSERRAVLPVCIVAGNKCDLQGMRQVGAREGLDWARSRGYGFMETSAREMVNIEETFAREYRRQYARYRLSSHRNSARAASRCCAETTRNGHVTRVPFVHGPHAPVGSHARAEGEGAARRTLELGAGRRTAEKALVAQTAMLVSSPSLRKNLLSVPAQPVCGADMRLYSAIHDCWSHGPGEGERPGNIRPTVRLVVYAA